MRRAPSRPRAATTVLDVAAVSRSAYPRSGGIEAHLRLVSLGLAARGHHVRVWASRIDDEPFTRTNTTLSAQRFAPFFEGPVETLPLPMNVLTRAAMLPVGMGAFPGADRLGYDTLREATLPSVTRALAPRLKIAFGEPSIVHSYGAEQLGHAAERAARSLGRPFVVTPFAHPGHWGDDEMNFALYRRADAVVALLPSEAAFYADRGVDETKIHVVGAAAPEPRAASVDVRATHGIDGPLVLCLGVKRPYKYRALLDALTYIGAKNARFAFVGPRTPSSRRDFGACHDPRVIETGKVDEAEKWSWLAAADVLCLPSVSEILPVSILEAWQTRTAVVVAEGRYTRDLVADGTDGIVCGSSGESIAQAIEEILGDRERAAQMGRSGSAKVERLYAAPVVSERHEELYRSLM